MGSDEILVKILAAPINHADLNMVEGTYGTQPSLPAVGGNEGVGVVVSKGAGVAGVKEGDWVVPARAGLGTWRTAGVWKSEDWFSVPKDLKKEYLATLSAPSTALRLLTDFVALKEGDVVIQNGANGAVGTALIQIAHHKKIKTINVIRDRPTFTEMTERLKGLGGYSVFSDKYLQTAQFERLMSDTTRPKLALNAVGGASATQLARTLG